MMTVDAIQDKIGRLQGKYSPYQIFSDWVKMMAIGIQNGCDIHHGRIWKNREKQYLSVAAKYSKEEMDEMSNMTLMLIELMGSGLNDWLGKIYMMSGNGNGRIGQFFTPYSVSIATAETRMKSMKDQETIHLYEPSTGSGGMIIAAADVLNRRGINYQKKLKVIAQDIDWLAVYMTYVQLSLYGVNAKVIQGDTLSESNINSVPADRILYTPRRAGMLI